MAEAIASVVVSLSNHVAWQSRRVASCERAIAALEPGMSGVITRRLPRLVFLPAAGRQGSLLAGDLWRQSAFVASHKTVIASVVVSWSNHVAWQSRRVASRRMKANVPPKGLLGRGVILHNFGNSR